MENEVKPFGLIYLITNLINGKIYVGKTKLKLSRRWRTHIWQALRGEFKGYLQYAIAKYGPENFKIEEIDKAFNTEELSSLEVYHTLRLNSLEPEIGYNILLGSTPTKRSKIKRLPKGGDVWNFNHEVKDKEISDLYKYGFSSNEIAEMYDTSRPTITKRLRKNGVEVKRVYKSLFGPENSFYNKNIDSEKIAEEYLSGTSCTSLAKKYAVSSTCISDRLKVLGVKLRTQKEAQNLRTDDRASQTVKEISIESFASDYLNGMTGSELSVKYGVSRGTALTRVKKAGVKIRSNSEAQYLKNGKSTTISGWNSSPPAKENVLMDS